MARKRQANPLSTTRPNISSRTNERAKPPLYQSSLEQFLRPTSTQGNKENQLTTPANKRKRQTDNVHSTYFTKKRKFSSELPLTTKNSTTGTGTGTGEDASAPIVIADDSDDGLWEGDTLFNSASSTRTLCVELEKTLIGSKSKLDHPYYPPTSATPPSHRSSSLEAPPPRSRNLSILIPSSQAHERSSPLEITLDNENDRVSDSLFFPLSIQTPDTSDEVIPSSQSQYLLPFVISPQRVRKFIGKPPSPSKEVIPCSQEPQGLDLVLFDKQNEGNDNLGRDCLVQQIQSTDVTNSFDSCGEEADKPPSSDQYDHSPGGLLQDHTTEANSHNVVIATSELPATVKLDDIDPALDCGTSPSLMSSSLPHYGEDDSQYTFMEETCPSDIREFLDELDKRNDVESTYPEVPADLEIDRMVSPLGDNQPPTSEDSLHGWSLPSMASSSQFTTGSSSQYTFIEASLPSDIAEFLDRLDDSLEP